MEENKNLEKRKKMPIFLLNFGKLILDAVKLVFASLVIGIILKGDIPQSTLLIAGIIISGSGTILGLILVTIFGEK